jgi:geranylgeranyl diphosphate synthase type I
VSDDLREATFSYPLAAGKGLRGSLLLLTCELLGGDPLAAIPAAAAVEVFHNFSLVHDDIIDDDRIRRNAPTIHAAFAQRAASRYCTGPQMAARYGVSTAILAGDALQGLAVSMLLESHTRSGFDQNIVLSLTDELFGNVLRVLVEGELLDVQFSYLPPQDVGRQEIIQMMSMKTGALYEYCAKAGAQLGLSQHAPNSQVSSERAKTYLSACGNYGLALGVAFQIRDDVLGLISTAEDLGKPIGSDIREGKRTLLISHALEVLEPSQRQVLLNSLGNQSLSDEDVLHLRSILRDSGVLDFAAGLAGVYVQEAKQALSDLPESPAKRHLRDLADFVVERNR